MKRIFRTALSILIFLFAWELIARAGFIHISLFPPPSRVAMAFVEMARSGELLRDIRASMWRAHDHSAILWYPQEYNRSFYIGVFAGMAIVLIALHIAWKGLGPFVMPLKHAVMSWFFVGLLAISVVFLFVTVHMADTYDRKPGLGRWDNWWRLLQENPGGIFAVFTGLATVFALIYTWRELSALRQSISSFSDLIDRVCRMAMKATAENPLQILAYTPAIGYLAQPKDDWHRFKNALRQEPKGNPIAEIICLRSKDLEIWHNLFVGRSTLRGPVTKELANAATHAAEGLLRDLSLDSDDKPVLGTVHRLPWRFMPGFYLFMIRDRAIIVTPFFMPFPKGAPREQQEKLPTVQMIGVETHDRAIIRDVQNIFQYYKALPDRPLGEAEQTVQCATFQAWLTSAANADSTMTALRDAILASPGLGAAITAAQTPANLNCQISLGLDAHIKTW